MGSVITALVAVVAFATPAAAQESSDTTVQAVPSSVAVGAPVELIATVSCPNSPSGGLGVTFVDGGDILETVPVEEDNTARYPTTFDTAGTHTITAAYNGNEECFASNDTTTVTVSAVTPPSSPPASPQAPCRCGGPVQSINIHTE
ncbi:Ig-like domain-containing protein [Streptomyces sp. WMMB 714]|uniref:Ig-like domain-containing protein n=1 Tax=Streptomyces sp. WMMB 714 TaxID=1286822 RepID=UPI0015869325|nr:Ig-like domain-containing protein [Streptomyces sp. WMMB 714]